MSRRTSVFYPPELARRARDNAERYPWAAEARRNAVEAARPWIRMSDDDLWALMFGNTIKRSWMVWSNGHCPACGRPVPMYNWEMDALKRPWKTRCPQCGEVFPKNDFHAFYRSGLDVHGVFQPDLADRTLLFNAERPDPSDPRHTFGVDDGEGYVEGHDRWRFIGAYLIYGQWKQAIVGGIQRLADAYTLTGDAAYAHKAGVLLDRVADLYPTHDFGQQGVMYEGPPRSGYVSTWHDACEETRALVLAYDQTREALADDTELAGLLAEKARQHRIGNPKTTCADVLRNIEDGILRDALTNRDRIYSNYPRTDVTVATILAVLDWPGNRDEVYALLDAIVEKTTAVDGLTGEKGLAGYSVIGVRSMAEILRAFSHLDSDFLNDMLRRHPRLHETFRFHVDTWCLGQYYPQCGDTGAFARKVPHYVGVPFSRSPGLGSSMFSFLWRLYELTGDAAFVQVLYHANGGSTDGLPYDLLAEDPEAFRRSVADVIARDTATPALESVNKQEWRLAILRAGEGEHSRALWLDYDAGGGHGHWDGMNVGLFAKGLDLMPDFGYPPVQFGGWGAPRAVWYTMTAAHNTVVVDGKNQRRAQGRTTLWADGRAFRALRASCPELIEGDRYERTLVMVDISERDFYIFDAFHVAGGQRHDKFQHSHFGHVTTHGLTLGPAAEEYEAPAQMRGFRRDAAPQPGWWVEWAVEDRYGYLSPGRDVRFRYTDLTEGAEVFLLEGWIAPGGYDGADGVWIPRVLVRRRAMDAPLSSTFLAVVEPYEGSPGVVGVRRLPIEDADGIGSPSNVAVEVVLADGSRDLFVARDASENGPRRPAVQKEWAFRSDGELCWARRSPAGEIVRTALCRGHMMRVGRSECSIPPGADFAEWEG
jgi:hypothetical protein